MAQYVNLGNIQLQDGTTNTYFVTWTFGGKHVDKFTVSWSYWTGGVWFSAPESSTNATVLQSTYNPPANAKKIKVKVKPVSKTHKVKTGNKTETKHYWTGGWKETKPFSLPGDVYIPAPATPNVEISKGKLTATVDSYETSVTLDAIEFQVIKNGETLAASGTANITYNTATFVCTVDSGNEYKVRARAVRRYQAKTVANTTYVPSITSTYKNGRVIVNKWTAVTEKKLTTKIDTSLWSEFSSPVTSGAGRISGVPGITATSSTQVLLTWNASANATGYEIEYTKKPEYFDSSSSEVQSETVDQAVTKWYISGLDNQAEEGKAPIWYFRIRGTDRNGEPGPWSTVVSVQIGEKPKPPTTWSYTTTGKIGEDILLNWAHTSADGSYQTAAMIGLKVGDAEETTIQITGDAQSYTLNTDAYSDGSIIKWRVKTKGAVAEYSDWSTQRQITLYLPPTVSVGLYEKNNWLWDPFNFTTDTIYTAVGEPETLLSELSHFPAFISALASPETQHAIGFVIRITANEGYETVDEIGLYKKVGEGDEVYSGYFEGRPNINLCNVHLGPGDVDFENGISYTIHVTVSMDSGLTAEGEYIFSVNWDETMVDPDAELTVNMTDFSCFIRPFCVNDDDEPVTDITFSVYRRMYDGTFVEIMSDIDGENPVTVTDPHPSLDYARYRIVAISKETGAVSFSDIPAVPMLYSAIVMQWDEAWTYFDYDEDADTDTPPWSGSLLVLPYNIDVQATHAPDVELVEYIGREHPVSYYGTQKGESATWQTEIPKEDTDTIYQIRRLSRYSGDVYVREPSGIGYWANVAVSYSETHGKPVVPVTFNITRVEGGA